LIVTPLDLGARDSDMPQTGTIIQSSPFPLPVEYNDDNEFGVSFVGADEDEDEVFQYAQRLNT
jgi:hypothetical protein